MLTLPIAQGLAYAEPRQLSRNPPPFASEMLVRIDDESPRYSDAAGTIRQVYDGGPVRAVRDISGNGFLASLTAGTATLRTTRYTRQATEYSSSTFSLGIQPAIGTILNLGTNWSCIWLAKPTGSGTMTLLWNGTARTQMQFQSTATIWRCGQVSASNGTTAPSDATTVPHTYGFSPYYAIGTGTDCTRAYIAGAPVQCGTASMSATTDNASVWNMPGGGGNYTGDILACYLFKRRLFPHEMLRVSDHLYDRFGLTNPRAAAAKVVVWQSNSLSVLNQFPQQLPELIRASLSYPAGSIFHLGVTSKSWSAMLTENPTLVDPLLVYLKDSPVGPGDPVYCQWDGVNDTVVSNCWSDCDARVAAGGVRKARIIVGDVIAKSTATAPTWEATRATTNASLASGLSAHAGVLAVPSGDAVLGDPSASGMGSATYSPDGTHLNNTSAPLAVPYFVAAINAV